jgi:class 3 adenylate cyclase
VRGAPETKYAKSGNLHLAYQVTGEGTTDLVVVPSFVSHVEAEWEEFPQYRRFYERLGERFRVIRFDKRGVGMSDRLGDRVPSVEERIDDVVAVMDATGSERAAIMGLSEGGALSILFAATYPEKSDALLLWGASARQLVAPDHPDGVSPEFVEAVIPGIEGVWGTGVMYSTGMAPSLSGYPGFQEAAARVERLSATPGAVGAITRMNYTFDVRYALELIHVPTLVMHRSEDITCAVGNGRYLAEHLPDARFIEYPGMDHLPWFGDATDQVIADIEEFVTGERTKGAEHIDRVLATVLFTDIVDSTARAAAMGDRRWRDFLDQHDNATRDHIDRFSGRLVKSTGDGCLATFVGPGRALLCAMALRDFMRASGVHIRVGVHAGEVELRGEDIGGIAVHIGSRIAALARPDEVLASRTVVDLVTGSGFEFDDRGEHELKGVPGSWKLFVVRG